MKSVKFSEVVVGQTFTFNGSEYTKAEKKRVSCCSFTNAYLSADQNQKIGIAQDQTVEVAE